MDPVEIICPDVKQPGEYFNCVVDIPTGHNLTAEVIMVDNVMLDQVQAEQYFLVQYILADKPVQQIRQQIDKRGQYFLKGRPNA